MLALRDYLKKKKQKQVEQTNLQSKYCDRFTKVLKILMKLYEV